LNNAEKIAPIEGRGISLGHDRDTSIEFAEFAQMDIRIQL
jgi:hypothetical protein